MRKRQWKGERIMALEGTERQLAEMPLFADLPELVLQQLAELAEPRQYGMGEVLFQEGAHCDDLLVLQQGKVQLQMFVPGHGRIPILTLGPGQLMAWSAIVGTGKMTTSAVALEVCQVWALPADHLREVCEQDHALGFRFMERLSTALARRLVATRLQLLDLFASEPPPIPLKEEQVG